MQVQSLFDKFVSMWQAGFAFGLSHGLVIGFCLGALSMAVLLYFWEKRNGK